MKNSATYTSGRGARLNGQRFLINFEVCLLDSQELLATCATIAVHTSGDVAIVEVAMLKRIPVKHILIQYIPTQMICAVFRDGTCMPLK